MQTQLRALKMDETLATESPPWNPAPPSPQADQDSEDLPVQSVKQELQEELERCSTEDAVGETIFSRSWLLSLLVKAVDYVHTGTQDADVTVDHTPSPHPLASLTADGHGGVGSSAVDTHQEQNTSTPDGASEGEGEECGGGDVRVARKHGGHPFDDSGGGGVMSQPSNSGRYPQELDEDIENDMCKLWDTSVNKVSASMKPTHTHTHTEYTLIQYCCLRECLVELRMGVCGGVTLTPLLVLDRGSGAGVHDWEGFGLRCALLCKCWRSAPSEI